MGAARDLDDARPQAHGVVAGHHARVAATEDEGEVAGGRPPGGVGRERGPGEALFTSRRSGLDWTMAEKPRASDLMLM